jgi:hypothetical protein
MSIARLSFWGLLVGIGVLTLAACEPYMSMTDQVPSQTRRAATLLPESPNYVGMVDIETALQAVEELSGSRLVDSLQQTDDPYLKSFLTATDLDPKTDLRAVYGALVGEQTVSAVLFGDLSADQLNQYLEQAPGDVGRATTYRGVPLYHLALRPGESEEDDSLSVAFVGEGTMAVAKAPDQVTDMVDRHRDERGGLRANGDYMSLVKRVGRESTAWIAGRNVVETALQDSAGTDTEEVEAEPEPPEMLLAGLQGPLLVWSTCALVLFEVSALDGRTGKRLDRLATRLREQAVSLQLTDTALEGTAFLTMKDEASASSVVDVAEGALAVLKLSGDRLDERHRNLLDDVDIEQNGAIVRIQFSLDRELVRERVRGDRRSATAYRETPSARPIVATTRRMKGITPGTTSLRESPKGGSLMGLSPLTTRGKRRSHFQSLFHSHPTRTPCVVFSTTLSRGCALQCRPFGQTACDPCSPRWASLLELQRSR